MKKIILAILFIIFYTACNTAIVSKNDQDTEPQIPTKGMVTMVDLGSTKCIPCKMMAPILEELKNEYKGKVSIIFIDVKTKKEIAKKFGVTTIPTQIFFDSTGKEFWRHTGFLDRKAIVGKLEEMRVYPEAHEKPTGVDQECSSSSS